MKYQEGDFTKASGSFGAALPMISWERSHSIRYAVLHGLCGWIYVLWFVIWGRS
jgi:hypothetical protein